MPARTQRKRTLNVVIDRNGRPFAVCDSVTGTESDVIYLGAGDTITWVTSKTASITVKFDDPDFWSPFGNWADGESRRSGSTIKGTVGSGLPDGKSFKYSIQSGPDPANTLDPKIIIDN